VIQPLRAVLRASRSTGPVAILRCFGIRRPDLGISELARATGLSTSTVHRLLL
jgi:DNA-binding IclR family transcriptional regulator